MEVKFGPPSNLVPWTKMHNKNGPPRTGYEANFGLPQSKPVRVESMY